MKLALNVITQVVVGPWFIVQGPLADIPQFWLKHCRAGNTSHPRALNVFSKFLQLWSKIWIGQNNPKGFLNVLKRSVTLCCYKILCFLLV